MATSDGSILIRTNVDQTGINKGMKSISNSLIKIGSLVKLALGVGFIALGKQAIGLASDLAEVQNVVDTAFGDMAYKIEEFSKTSIEQFGLSELSAKQMASTFAAMSTGMGQGLDESTDKAVELTARLGDIASFYNKTQSEVETIGRAVYSGETEPLKQIGLIMTEAQLQTFALANGYKQLYKDMIASDRLLVRQEFFLANTNLAAGDFVKTQDSWANQTRILQQRWEQFLAVIGSGLINVLAPAVSYLNYAVSNMIKLADALTDVLGIQRTVENSSSSTVDNQDDLTDSVNGTTSALKKQLAFFDDINVLSQDTASSGSSSGGGSIDPVVPDSTETEKELSGLAKQIKVFIEEIKEAWVDGADFTFLGTYVGNAINNLFDNIDWNSIKKNAFKVGKGVATFMNGAIEEIDWYEVGKTLVESFNTIFATFGGFVKYFDFDKFGESLADGLNGVVKNLDAVEIIDSIEDLANGLITSLTSFVKEADWESVGYKIAEALESIDWVTILKNLGVLISSIIGGSINIAEGIKQAQIDSEEGKSELEKLIPDTLWEWLQFGGATIGLDIEYAFINRNGEVSGMDPFEQLQYFEEKSKKGDLKLQPVLEPLETTDFDGGLRELTDSFFENAGADISSWFTENVSPLFAPELWTAFGETMSSGFSIGVSEVSGWIDGISSSLETNLTEAGLTIGEFWDKSVAPLFTKDFWATIGKSIKDGFNSGVIGIGSILANMTNSLITGLESLTNGFIDGINAIIEATNKIPGVNIGKLGTITFDKIEIPTIATGTATPTNSVFQQQLAAGYASGTTISRDSSSPFTSQKQEIVLNLDGKTLARATLDNTLSELTRQGYDLAIVK